MNSIQHIKIPLSLLDRMNVDHARINAQINAMADNPTAYTGEVLKHALNVIQWHLGEQSEQLEVLQRHAHRINRLIDKTDEILQKQQATHAFTAQSYEVLTRQDERLLRGNV
ncbi:hypothetical protein F9851_06370 [Glaesserella parasuis]|uniref:hypothetical protein n=1 Tax=Glaesserella parasuis TaxID=738 RepID=UPI001329848D|nr:hypothetical protein [Glaesserella parasuis]MDO9759317.1 hypothetical protein [Glaesserella parasuis]MWQ20446.1 hypothetical protein [Glaesserella parasuis]MWQ78793.1 hypothetical protein [Glaesserella parasuis]